MAKNLSKLTKKQLETYARTLGLELDRRLKKSTLLEQVRAAEKPKKKAPKLPEPILADPIEVLEPISPELIELPIEEPVVIPARTFSDKFIVYIKKDCNINTVSKVLHDHKDMDVEAVLEFTRNIIVKADTIEEVREAVKDIKEVRAVSGDPEMVGFDVKSDKFSTTNDTILFGPTGAAPAYKSRGLDRLHLRYLERITREQQPASNEITGSGYTISRPEGDPDIFDSIQQFSWDSSRRGDSIADMAYGVSQNTFYTERISTLANFLETSTNNNVRKVRDQAGFNHSRNVRFDLGAVPVNYTIDGGSIATTRLLNVDVDITYKVRVIYKSTFAITYYDRYRGIYVESDGKTTLGTIRSEDAAFGIADVGGTFKADTAGEDHAEDILVSSRSRYVDVKVPNLPGFSCTVGVKVIVAPQKTTKGVNSPLYSSDNTETNTTRNTDSYTNYQGQFSSGTGDITGKGVDLYIVDTGVAGASSGITSAPSQSSSTPPVNIGIPHRGFLNDTFDANNLPARGDYADRYKTTGTGSIIADANGSSDSDYRVFSISRVLELIPGVNPSVVTGAGGFYDEDTQAHGTTVAQLSGGYQTSLAPDTRIYASKGLDTGGTGAITGSASSVMMAVNNVLVHHNHKKTLASDTRPSVCNMSIGFPIASPLSGTTNAIIYLNDNQVDIDSFGILDDLQQTLTDAGVHVTAAAGNDSANTEFVDGARSAAKPYTGGHTKNEAWAESNTIGLNQPKYVVGALSFLDGKEKASTFSNYGAGVNVWAPGDNITFFNWKSSLANVADNDIRVSYPLAVDNSAAGGGYGQLFPNTPTGDRPAALTTSQGTSFAAPLVAGVIAQYLQEFPKGPNNNESTAVRDTFNFLIDGKAVMVSPSKDNNIGSWTSDLEKGSDAIRALPAGNTIGSMLWHRRRGPIDTSVNWDEEYGLFQFFDTVNNLSNQGRSYIFVPRTPDHKFEKYDLIGIKADYRYTQNYQVDQLRGERPGPNTTGAEWSFAIQQTSPYRPDHTKAEVLSWNRLLRPRFTNVNRWNNRLFLGSPQNEPSPVISSSGTAVTYDAGQKHGVMGHPTGLVNWQWNLWGLGLWGPQAINPAISNLKGDHAINNDPRIFYRTAFVPGTLNYFNMYNVAQGRTSGDINSGGTFLNRVTDYFPANTMNDDVLFSPFTELKNAADTKYNSLARLFTPITDNVTYDLNPIQSSLVLWDGTILEKEAFIEVSRSVSRPSGATTTFPPGITFDSNTGIVSGRASSTAVTGRYEVEFIIWPTYTKKIYTFIVPAGSGLPAPKIDSWTYDFSETNKLRVDFTDAGGDVVVSTSDATKLSISSSIGSHILSSDTDATKRGTGSSSPYIEYELSSADRRALDDLILNDPNINCVPAFEPAGSLPAITEGTIDILFDTTARLGNVTPRSQFIITGFNSDELGTTGGTNLIFETHAWDSGVRKSGNDIIVTSSAPGKGSYANFMAQFINANNSHLRNVSARRKSDGPFETVLELTIRNFGLLETTPTQVSHRPAFRSMGGVSINNVINSRLPEGNPDFTQNVLKLNNAIGYGEDPEGNIMEANASTATALDTINHPQIIPPFDAFALLSWEINLNTAALTLNFSNDVSTFNVNDGALRIFNSTNNTLVTTLEPSVVDTPIINGKTVTLNITDTSTLNLLTRAYVNASEDNSSLSLSLKDGGATTGSMTLEFNPTIWQSGKNRNVVVSNFPSRSLIKDDPSRTIFDMRIGGNPTFIGHWNGAAALARLFTTVSRSSTFDGWRTDIVSIVNNARKNTFADGNSFINFALPSNAPSDYFLLTAEAIGSDKIKFTEKVPGALSPSLTVSSNQAAYEGISFIQGNKFATNICDQDIYRANEINDTTPLVPTDVHYVVITTPSIVDWSFDGNANKLQITFDLPVDTATFDSTKDITIYSEFGSYTVTGIAHSVVGDPNTIQIGFSNTTPLLSTLQSEDISDILSNPVRIDNTTLSVEQGIITASSTGNSSNSISGINPSSLVAILDLIAPELVSASVDLDNYTMTLNVSERCQNTFTPRNFIIYGAGGITSFYGLQDSTISSVTDDSIIISLSARDQTGIVNVTNNGATGNTLSTRVGYIIDEAGNNGASILNRPITVTPDSADRIRPSANNLTLNLENNMMSITFDEQIVTSGATRSQDLQIIGSVNIHTLSSSNTITSSGNTVTIALSSAEAELIKVATDNTNSTTNPIRLAGPSGFVSDTSGNLSNTFDLSVNTFTPAPADVTPPVLDSWDLNLENFTITLEFNEAVSATSFRVNQLTINSLASYRLLGGTFNLSTDGKTMTIALTQFDRDILIQSTNNTGTNGVSPTLSAPAGFVADISAVGNEIITNKSVRTFTPKSNLDTTKPELNKWTLSIVNPNNASAVFTSNKPLSANDITKFTITVEGTAIAIDSSNTVSINGSQIFVTFSTAQTTLLHDALDISTGGVVNTIATDISLTSTAGWATDTATINNTADAITTGRIPSRFTSPDDSTVPTLVGWDLDLHRDRITLIMSEPVVPSSLTLTSLTIEGSTGSSYTLTGGTIQTTTNGNVVVTELNSTDAAALLTTTGNIR